MVRPEGVPGKTIEHLERLWGWGWGLRGGASAGDGGDMERFFGVLDDLGESNAGQSGGRPLVHWVVAGIDLTRVHHFGKAQENA